jgi:hypothetical protein
MDLSTMSYRPLGLFAHSFIDNFLAALMMLLGLKRAFKHLHPTPNQFLIFLIGSLLTTLSFDLVSQGLDGELQPVGFAAYLMPPFLLLIVGVFISQRYGVWRVLPCRPLFCGWPQIFLWVFYNQRIQWDRATRLVTCRLRCLGTVFVSCVIFVANSRLNVYFWPSISMGLVVKNY